MEQVKNLFEMAYENSLTSERHLPPGFLKTDDEVATLISGGDIMPRREYADLYNQSAVSCTDEKMASVVANLHPGLQYMCPDIPFDAFPVYETPEDAFARAVEEISDDPGITL